MYMTVSVLYIMLCACCYANTFEATYYFFTPLQGRPQDLRGGVKNFLFKIWEFACREVLLGGFGGMLPR